MQAYSEYPSMSGHKTGIGSRMGTPTRAETLELLQKQLEKIEKLIQALISNNDLLNQQNKLLLSLIRLKKWVTSNHSWE